MKREREESDEPPRDPVLSQLDFLINGPPKEARAEPPPPSQDPVLLHLDALINGGSASATAPLVSPPQPPQPPPPLMPPAPVVEDEPRGPPGILREFGGVAGWMRLRGHATSPKRTTPPPVAVRTNTPSSHQAT
jgi:hypothetical protein